jgi:O-antigen biosynthesis protein
MSSERLLLEENNPWWGEHTQRYEYALDYIKKDYFVLDIACGTGFGTEILSNQAKSVIGGDISQEDIDQNKRVWGESEKMRFQQMDGTLLPYDENTFEAIVSFETIEHTTKYREMLKEFSRVLKKDGILILSTPNARITSPNGIIPNPFHTQEFKYEELKSLLQENFSSVIMKGQKNKNIETRGFFENLINKFLLLRGIRKLSYTIRNGCMKTFFGKTLYPTNLDFEIVEGENVINKTCPVLFTISKK